MKRETEPNGRFGAPRPAETPTRRRFLRQALAGAGLTVCLPKLPPHSEIHLAPVLGAQGKDVAHLIRAVSTAGEAFLKALSAEQRAAVMFALDDDQRQDWHFVPKPRKGVPYKQLDPTQRRLADALLNTALSRQGFGKVSTIISLENVLREIERGGGPVRDPELYYLSVFGEPGPAKPWGWSLEGHHISLNFTLVGPGQIASTPAFLGANPAEVRGGPRQGVRALAAEEDTARALLKSLDERQRAQAVVSDSAPRDILSGNSRKADPLQPAGLPASRLSGRQAEVLMQLLKEYADTMAPPVAAARLRKLQAAGVGQIHFAWAGGGERGQPHYYRVQGPTFLVEYDNVQNDANHIHSVWRDFDGDFGLDLLAEHYKKAHR